MTGQCALLVDLRLHGRSEAGTPPHTIAACADDLAALLAEQAAAGRPVRAAVGHSFGGKVVVALRGRGADLAQTWMLDSSPSARPGAWESPDNEVRRRTSEYLGELARLCRDLGGNLMVLGSPLQRNLIDGITAEQADDLTCATLGHCLKTLERTGVTLCLEPLGPVETNYINAAAHAVRLIERFQHPNVKLHLDVKAMSAEPQSIPETIAASREHAFHFHANDPNRRGPGFGDTDFKPIFQALKDANYSGWVSVEVFDYSPDPETIARESIRYMKECQ